MALSNLCSTQPTYVSLSIAEAQRDEAAGEWLQQAIIPQIGCETS